MNQSNSALIVVQNSLISTNFVEFVEKNVEEKKKLYFKKIMANLNFISNCWIFFLNIIVLLFLLANYLRSQERMALHKQLNMLLKERKPKISHLRYKYFSSPPIGCIKYYFDAFVNRHSLFILLILHMFLH